MRKLKSLVCGSKFGQFYIDAISKMKECVEFIGIFSNGSERSRLCAEKYNVNLYTSIDKIPEDIDIVFIAVRTGVMGGDGSELALKFLSKGIHVFIEQPIHIDEMKKCVKCSIEKGVFFHVANFYKYMDTVHKYIECSKGLLRKNEILSIECACANQVIYSLLDNILRIFREKARFSIENFWIQNQDFFIASGSINDIPLSIKVYNSVNTVDSDSYCYYLQQINIYTSEGMLFMVDVNGPIIWKPQFRAAHDLFIKKGDELDQRIFDSKMYWYESESELSYKDIFCKKWIDAIKKEIKEFIDNIYFEKMTEYRRKIQSEIVIPSIWGLITQKIGYPRLYQNANHAVDLNNYVLDFFEEKNTFLNDSLEIKKTANNIDFYLEPDITYGYVEEAKHIMNIACLESISYKLYEATGEKENISITEIVSCLKVADSNMHILQRWLNALSENGYIECNAGKIKWKKKNTNKMLNISTNDIVFGVSRLSFDLSVYDIFGILSAGGKLFLPDENRIADPSYLFETIVKQKITVWNSVPAIMQMILEYRENEKRTEQFNIRCSLLSGDWIPLTLPERLISACMEKTRVISLGGATEAAIWSIYYEYEYLFDEWKSIPYGKALPNQEVYVLDSKKEICPLGAVGDIFISGIGLAKGYLNEPLLTEKAFIMVNGERMYDTGDKGKYLEDGNIEFLGRRDTQVKLNGFRVELGEIEANIEKIKSVKYAAVLCREKGREKRVIAYVEPQPSEFTEDFSLYVLNELKRMLPAYMIPYNIRVMKLPLTSNGKIDRKYLENIEIIEDKKEADTKNTINSDSSTYFPIKEIWCKLLQRSDIRPDSDLRSFGADSLIMAQAVGKIRNFLKESGSQCDVPFDILLKQTINSPTLSEIVSYIDQIILKKEVNSRYEDAEVNEEELGKLKIHKKGKEDKLVVIFHAGLGSIDEFLPFIQGLCNEEKGTIVSIALNNVKQYLDFYAGHLYESVADKYTKIILDLGYDKIQLIGHCVGGMIAFEVAKNMMDKGVDVIDVSLIDSIPGKYSIEDEVVMELMFLPMVNITYPVLAEYQLNERELYEYMDEKFGKYTGIEQKSKNKVEEYINGLREIEKEERIRLYINSVSKNMPIQMFVYLFDIFKQSTNGAIYKPIPYLGDIRLFIAEDTEKIVFHRSEEVINFWRENCIGDVTVIMIPGNHLTCFTDVNNIQKLVNMITEK